VPCVVLLPFVSQKALLSVRQGCSKREMALGVEGLVEEHSEYGGCLGHEGRDDKGQDDLQHVP
jgi:hypothetical protein